MAAKETNLNYEYDVFLEGESAAAKVIRMVGADNKVLEVGAGPGSITKHLSGNKLNDVIALEVNEAAINSLKKHCRKVYKLDLNSDSWAGGLSDEENFDVIVAADVLEHLYNPWKTLEQMATLLTENGYVVLSIPHISHAAILACLADEDFAYSEWGLLDKTHIRFFGIKNMEQLVINAGLKIVAAEFVVKSPEDTEFSKKWSTLSDNIKDAFSKHRYSDVYQVVIKAALKESNEKSISLSSLNASVPNISMQQRMIRLARKIIPESVLIKIKSILSIKSRY